MIGFDAERLNEEQLAELQQRRNRVGADIVRLTSLANSGHPGGSLSTLDALLVLYQFGNLDSNTPQNPERDRVVISHGHVSPGVYGTLAEFGFFDIREAYRGFRRAGSVFGGHIENVVPGVEWNTGNLGQGLSVGCGFAMAAQIHGKSYCTFVGMGDGEQQKGQISEARRFAAKFNLSRLIAFVDVNGLQIGGKTDKIMPMQLSQSWASDGWNVLEVDGHDFQAMYAAFRAAVRRETANPERPTVLLLRTIMGKGISEIENDHNYHGQALPDALADKAFSAFGIPNNLAELREDRRANASTLHHHVPLEKNIQLDVGVPRNYPVDQQTDCRSAYGNALADLAKLNGTNGASWPVVGISCDLEGSVKMNAFHAATPDRFIETGIAEHHAAVLAGALSKEKIVPFYSTFGMFAFVEGYNQQRLNDQNSAAPKVVATHCGLDVGEDGPTHQCIDYVSVLSNLYGAEIYVPADPNETDRIIRKVATRYAPTFVAMGRSKLPTITSRDGRALLGEGYDFVPGKWAELRPGNDAVIFAFGPMVYRAVQASDLLFGEGFGVRVINASSLKPFDRDCIVGCAKAVPTVLTWEDHNVNSGLGQIVASVLGDEGISAKLTRFGVKQYGTSGVPDQLFAEQGMAIADVCRAIRNSR